MQEVMHRPSLLRYRIKWDDGHESTYTPAAVALRRLTRKERVRGSREGVAAATVAA